MEEKEACERRRIFGRRPDYLSQSTARLVSLAFFPTAEPGARLVLHKTSYRVFSSDVMAAILVSQNNKTAAMLVSQTSPEGFELFSYANTFFCSNKFI